MVSDLGQELRYWPPTLQRSILALWNHTFSPSDYLCKPEQDQLGYLHVFAGLSIVLLVNTFTEYRSSVLTSSRHEQIIRHLPGQVYKCGVIG